MPSILDAPVRFGHRQHLPVLVWGEPTRVTIARPARALVVDGTVPAQIVDEIGGSAFATACAIGATGTPVELWAPISKDSVADRTAAGFGVTVHALGGPELRHTVVIAEGSARTMLSGTSTMFDDPHADGAVLGTGCLLHLSASSLARDRTGAVRRLVERTALPVSIDAGAPDVVRDVDLDTLCREVRPAFVFANEDEADALGWDTCPPYVGCYVIKRGGAIATAYVGTDVYERCAVPADVVDTTGAGDAFAAGMLAGWAAGLVPSMCLFTAHHVAQSAITRLGPLVGTDVLRVG